MAKVSERKWDGEGVFVIEQVRKRFKENKNWLAVVAGETGSGKSYSALRICEVLDPSFDASRVVWSVEEFLQLLNTDTLKRGNMVLFDEAGVGVPTREWYSISNKAVNYLLQTFRHEGIGCIFTVPTLDMIDSQTRKLFHTYIETKEIHWDLKQVCVKWLNMSVSPRYGKTYFLLPRYKGPQGYRTVDHVQIRMPSQKLIEDYEREKREFAINLRKSLEKDVKENKASKKAKMKLLNVLSKESKEIVDSMLQEVKEKEGD